MVLKLQSGHDFVLETATYEVQRGIAQKSINTRVMVLAFCTSLMLVNICIKFHDDTLNGFQITEQT